MLIAILNESKMVSNNDIEIICKAIQIQVDSHFLPAWNMREATITFYSDKNQVPSNAWVIHIIDESPVQGALGFHEEEQNDKIDGYIMCNPILSNGGTVLHFNK